MNPRMVYALPLIAVILHIVEEFVWPGGFLAWDRIYRPQFAASITPRFALIANALLVAAALVLLSLGPDSSRGPSLWLTLAALVGGNAVYHLLGSWKTRRYSPGMVTGTLLYLPLCIGGYIWFLRSGIAPLQAAVSFVLGISYPVWSGWAHRRGGG